MVADDRELFAELDGLSKNAREKMDANTIKMYQSKGYDINVEDSKVEDGKKYIKYLARKESIILDLENSIVCYPNRLECPEKRVPSRHYANYDNTNLACYSPICESAMAKDIVDNISTEFQNKIELIRASAQNKTHVSRASYSDMCKKSASIIIQNIVNNTTDNINNITKNVKILVCSSIPHVKRHVNIAQLEVNNIINSIGEEDLNITVDGLGTLSHIHQRATNTSLVLSELGSLMLEKYRTYLYSSGVEDINIDNNINRVNFSCREQNLNKNNIKLRKKGFLYTKLFDFVSINPIDILLIKFLHI